ncbi:hypothetical protein F4808DRAFT_459190 [Astrocystis sublimbata]|nr:hypothetical protein F4808DRAFT_459190 [Astrocystis sublimbata]
MSTHHNMERDSRTDPNQWRPYRRFDKKSHDRDVSANVEPTPGLVMAQRNNNYYYDVDSSTATYSSSLATATDWPFRPSPSVKTLDVPGERRSRMKSISMNSLRNAEHKKVGPTDKFTSPRPAPVAGHRREFRITSASSVLPKRATRSVSPAPSWTGTARRILGFKSHARDQECDRGRKSTLRQMEDVFVEEEREPSVETRSATPSGSVRSRDLSPESLRRFLSDDVSSSSTGAEPTPGFTIPDDIQEEETEDNDDDDNFATAAVVIPAETSHLTSLSPPPFLRAGLSAPPASHSKIAAIAKPAPSITVTKKRSGRPAALNISRSQSSTSMASSSMVSAPASPGSYVSQGLSQFSFFDDSDDEDIAAYEGDRTLLGEEKRDRIIHTEIELQTPITSYSLPRNSSEDRKDFTTNDVLQSFDAPALVARNDNGVPTSFFALPNVDIGFHNIVGDRIA